MISLTLDQVADVVGGELAGPHQGRRVDAVTIDSRSARDGTLFVPLAGERTDGHDYVTDALRRGAVGFLWSADRGQPGEPGGVVVDDPADALLGLGAWMRDTVAPRVVAVTGSSGKTTTKDLVAAAVGAGRRTVANPGSYNNDLGVPLTCCLLEADTEVLVAEVGSRGLGHIARLATVLRPDVAVVTNVSGSHLELLGDVDTVARAKAELVMSLEPDGVAILNADDPRVAAMAGANPGRCVTFGRGDDATWRAVDVRGDRLARPRFSVVGPEGEAEVELAVPGVHNVSNALAALAVAVECDVPLAAAAAALAGATLSRWRMEVLQGPRGITILNDAYNANPASMAAALDTLAAMDVRGARWATLGTMAELGPEGRGEHEAVGRRCAEIALAGLVVVGQAAEDIAAGARAAGFAGALHAVPDVAAAATVLRAALGDGDVVLVKASRAAGLEHVAAGLVEETGA